MAKAGRRPALGDMVLVRWRDAHSDAGWTNLSEHSRDPIAYSVGFVVRLSDLAMTIASAIWDDPSPAHAQEVGDPCSIPWDMVLDWRKLK